MISLRRPSSEPRIEIMPLIDVIFLLLTFFIYAMVLMVRAELLPMNLQSYAAGQNAEPAPAVTISIRLDGTVYFNREIIGIDQLLPRIEQQRLEEPGTVVYLALADGSGDVDRAPILTQIWDQLKDAGLDIHLVGRPDGFESP